MRGAQDQATFLAAGLDSISGSFSDLLRRAEWQQLLGSKGSPKGELVTVSFMDCIEIHAFWLYRVKDIHSAVNKPIDKLGGIATGVIED
jgi:hypothetical protein